jgi:hypothetical protein
VRPRLIPNESVPGQGLPSWERFQRFVGMVVRVPKQEADKLSKAPVSAGQKGKINNVPRD